MKNNWKKQFAVIYSGQAFSILGSSAVQFAIVWWLTVQTQSAITLTTATIAGFLPNIFIGPFAGVWVDRYNRRTVMIVADGFVALSSAALGLAFLLGTPPVAFIYLILFLRGLGSVFHGPAMQAAVPMLVPEEMLTKAGGWSNMVNSMGNMVGPVIGAGLMQFFSIAGVMLVDILGAAFAIATLLFVRIPDVPAGVEKPQLLKDLMSGLREMRGNKPLMAVFFPILFCNLILMPLGSLFPLIILTHFGGEAWHTSIAHFTFAGGLLVASLIMGIWGGMKRRFLMVSIALGILGLAIWGGGLLPPSGFALFAVMAFLMGASGTFIDVPLIAYTQETTPPEAMGKVMSLLMTAMSLAMPLGLAVAGPVSEIAGVNRWFCYSGAAMVLVAVACWRNTRRFDIAR